MTGETGNFCTEGTGGKQDFYTEMTGEIDPDRVSQAMEAL